MAKKKLTVQETEKRIPNLAKSATRSAYRQAIKSGSSVLVSKNAAIHRVNSDGTSCVVKKISPQIKVKKAEVYKIK